MMVRKNITKRVLAAAMALLLAAGNSGTALTVKADDVFVYTDSAYNSGSQSYSSGSNFYLSSPATGFNVYNNISSGDSYSYNNFVYSNPSQSNSVQPEASFPTDPQFDTTPNQSYPTSDNQYNNQSAPMQSQSNTSQLQLNDQLQSQNVNQPSLAASNPNEPVVQVQSQLQTRLESEIISGVMNATATVGTIEVGSATGYNNVYVADEESNATQIVLGQIFTANTVGSYTKVNDATATIATTLDGQVVNCEAELYKLNSVSDNISSKSPIYKCTGSLTFPSKGEQNIKYNIGSPSGYGNYFAEGEVYAVRFKFTSSSPIKLRYGSYIPGYDGESFFTYGSFSQDVFNSNLVSVNPESVVEPADVTKIIVTDSKNLIKDNTIVLTQDELRNFNLSAVAYNSNNEPINRIINWETSNPTVANISAGTGASTITVGLGTTPGYAEITASNSSSNKNTTIKLYVVGNPTKGKDTEVEYTGSPTCPTGWAFIYGTTSDTSANVSISMTGADVSTDANFDIRFSNNTNITGVSRPAATITGKAGTPFAGYNKSYEFDVTPKDIYTVSETLSLTKVNTDTDVVVDGGATFGSLVMGKDYTIQLERTATAVGTITYSAVLTGTGNYYGEKTISPVTYAITEANKVPLSSIIARVEPSFADKVYTGSEITPILSELRFFDKNGSEISASSLAGIVEISGYSNNTNAGENTAIITIVATSTYANTYSGSVNCRFTITPKSISTGITVSPTSIVLKKSELDYETSGLSSSKKDEYIINKIFGNPSDPTAQAIIGSIKVDDITVPRTSYDVINTGSLDAIGTHILTIEGKGNFEGTNTVTYIVVGSLANDLTFTVAGDTVEKQGSTYIAKKTFVYSGTEYKPSVTVKDGRKTLELGRDYKIEDSSYQNNVNASKDGVLAQFTVTGMGAYDGDSVVIYFTILPKDVKRVTLDTTSYKYNGKEQIPSESEIKVYDVAVGGSPIDASSFDMEIVRVDGADYKNAGTKTITIAIDGNYKGSFTKTYKINKINISEFESKYSHNTNVPYTGKIGTSDQYYGVKLWYDAMEGSDLVSTDDYEVNVDTNCNVGDHYMSIEGSGTNIIGSLDNILYTIDAPSATNLTFKVNGKSYTPDSSGNCYTDYSVKYTGAYTTIPSNLIEVYSGDNKLTYRTDYVINSSITDDDKNANDSPKAHVTIVGRNNYSAAGNVNIFYKINPIDLATLSNVSVNVIDPDAKNVEVKIGTKILVENKDYEPVWSADYAVPGRNKEVTITGKGNYSGSVKGYYTKGTDISDYELVPVNPGTTIMYPRVSDSFYNVNYMGLKEPDFYLIKKTAVTKIPRDDTIKGDIVKAEAAGKISSSDYFKVTSDNYALSFSPTADPVKGYTGTISVTVTNTDSASATTFGSTSSSYKIMSVNMGLDSFGVTVNGKTQEEYDGSSHTITPSNVNVVYYYAGKEVGETVTLRPGDDYEIEVPSEPIKNVGSYSFKVTGKGLYSGSIDLVYEITKRNLGDHAVFAWDYSSILKPVSGRPDIPAANYKGGSPITPKFTVTDLGGSLSANSDYSVAWANNSVITVDTNYATLTLTGTGNYTGTITKQFEIKTVDMSAMSDVKFVSTDYYYTGSAIKPALGDFNVYIDDYRLIPGVDYKLPDVEADRYDENIKPSCVAGGGGRVTIEGIGTYQGRCDLKFPIYVNLNDSDIRFRYDTVDSADHKKGDNVVNSTGIPAAPSLDITSSNFHVYFDSVISSDHLVGSDAYTVTTTDTTTPGWCTISVAGKADKFIKEGFSFRVPIVASLNNASVTMTKEDYAFRGTGIEVKPDAYTVTLGGKELTKGKDYQVNDNNDGSVGKKTLTITACTDLTVDNSFEDGTGAKHPFIKDTKSADYYIKYDLNVASVTFTPSTPQTYDGKEYVFNSATSSQHALTPAVSVNGASVSSADLDFVSYPNTIKDAGTYQITITPKTGSTTAMGSKVATFEITGIDISDATIEYEHSGSYTTTPPSPDYTGSPITPAIQVKKGGKTLTENEDYTISWSDNINAGTATLTVTGKGSYQGSCTSTFEIKKKSIDSGVDIAKVDPYYAGGTADAPKPELTLTYGGKTLSEGVDYTVEINTGSKNASALSTSTVTSIIQNSPASNTYSATITGMGNFVGSKIAWYGIKKVDIASAMVILDEDSKTTTYTGNVINANDLAVILKYNFAGSTEPYTLVKGTDYEITCSSVIKDMGEYTIVIKGINNFEGKYDQQKYTVTARNIGTMYEQQKLSYVVNNDEPYPYTGSAVTPTAGDIEMYDLELPDKNDPTDATKHYRLEVNKDYKIVQYSNNTDATGEAIISVEGMGNYGGTLNLNFKIGKDIASAAKGYKVNLSYTERTFDGTAKTPTVKVESIDAPGTFLSNAYYTVSYPTDMINSNSRYEDPQHIETEFKTIKVTGRNGYFGTIEGTYKIMPVILNVADNAEGVSTAYHPITAGGIPLTVRTSLLGTPGNYYAYYEGTVVEPDVNSIKDPAITSGYTLKPYNADDESSAGIGNYYYDYKVSYNDSHTAGPASITISFSGNYVGTLGVPYLIKPRSVADETQGTLEVELENTEYQFKNAPITPNISKIYYRPYGSSTILDLSDSEYDVEFADNIYPGTAHAYVTCNGYYTGVKDVEFTIYGYMEDAVIQVENQFYTGNPITQLAEDSLSIFYGSQDNVLVEGVDYEITNISDASVPTNSWNSAGIVYVTGKGYYRNSASAEFGIEFNPAAINLVYNNDYKYTGKPIRPVITLMTPDGSVVPHDSSKITYTYYDPATGYAESEVYTATSTDGPIKPGYVRASIPVEVGTETTTVYAQYIIRKNDLAECIVSYSKKEEYTGSPVEPQVSVIDATTRELISPSEYTLTYSNNVLPGTDTAVIVITPVDGDKFDLDNTPSKSYYFSIVSPKIRNLASTATSATSVRITWSGSPRISGYILYDANGTQLQQTNKNFFDIDGLTPASSYNYQIAPMIGSDYIGEKQSVTAVTQISQAIGTVDDSVAGTSTITWTGNTNVLGYQIWRASTPNDPNHGTFIASVPRTSTNYTDKGLVSGRTYYYYLRGYTFNSDTRKFEYGQFSVAMPVTVK